jgi:hypothetical protein
MDILDRVSEPAGDLMRRVDGVLLAAGAPADHLVWPLLRKLGALPGDVVESFRSMRSAPLRAAAHELRARAERFADENAALAAAVAATPWQGDAAQQFTMRWRSLARHLGDRPAIDDDSLAGRLATTASYVDSVADWMDRARVALARSLGDALTSAEAVRLHGVQPNGRTGEFGALPPAATSAAAVIASEVLQTAIEQLTMAEDEHARWVGRLAELPFRQSVEAADRGGDPKRVAL